MPFLLLFLLLLACLPEDWQAPPRWLGLPEDAILYAAITWTGVLLVVAAAAWISRYAARRLYRAPELRDTTLQQYGRLRMYHFLALIVFYAVALYLFGWGWTVRCLGPVNASPPQLFPGAEVLILAPFVVGLVISWAFFFDVDRALHDTTGTLGSAPAWSRWSYVGFHARHNLALLLAPIILLIGQKLLHRAAPDLQDTTAFQFATPLLLAAVFIGLPWILRLVLGLTPLPAGPLRDRLIAASRRLHFRCSNILLWNTRGCVANAMVAGILPYPRYVLLTDRLIEELTPDEVEAVFGHEIGHIKHRHMPYYLGFLLGSLLAVASLWGAISPGGTATDTASPSSASASLGMGLDKDDWTKVPFVLSLGAYVFVVFGFLSRRCERQADIFGCRAVSCARCDCAGHDADAVLVPRGRALCPTGIRIFIEALEKVARVNGISRSRPGWLQSWQHSTIARRVDFLQRVLADPALEARFQRTVGLVKVGLLVAVGAVLIALGTIQGWQTILPN